MWCRGGYRISLATAWRNRLIGEQGGKVVVFGASGGASGLGGVSKPGG